MRHLCCGTRTEVNSVGPYVHAGDEGCAVLADAAGLHQQKPRRAAWRRLVPLRAGPHLGENPLSLKFEHCSLASITAVARASNVTCPHGGYVSTTSLPVGLQPCTHTFKRTIFDGVRVAHAYHLVTSIFGRNMILAVPGPEVWHLFGD